MVQTRQPTLWRGLLGRSLLVAAAAVALVLCRPESLTGTAERPLAAEPEGGGGTVSHGVPRPWTDRAGVEQDRPAAAAGSATPARARPAAEAALPRRSGTGRRIVYSINRQRVWLVRAGGRVERTYLVSGRLDQPRPATYRVYSKSRHTRSAISPERMELMVRFTQGRRTGTPIGFHSIPVRLSTGKPSQSLSQLGQPLSAGCIRQRKQDAAYLWRFAPVGTKVVVTR